MRLFVALEGFAMLDVRKKSLRDSDAEYFVVSDIYRMSFWRILPCDSNHWLFRREYEA